MYVGNTLLTATHVFMSGLNEMKTWVASVSISDKLLIRSYVSMIIFPS